MRIEGTYWFDRATRTPGTPKVWADPFVMSLRLPLMFNLRLDPYELASIMSNTYYDWLFSHEFLLLPAQD